MARFSIIRPVEGMEQFAQNQWIRYLRRAGHHVSTHNLRSRGIDPRKNLGRLVSNVISGPPDAIFVEGALGFNLPEFFADHRICKIPVAAFWYDDPYRSIEYNKHQEGYLAALKAPNVHHFVWDGYWRNWMKEFHGIDSHPTHLAADETEFLPQTGTHQFPEHITFIGTLVNSRLIEEKKSLLAPLLKQLFLEFEVAYRKEDFGTNPYQLFHKLLDAAPEKIRSAFGHMDRTQPEALLQLRSLIWMVGKNEVRIRILKQAVQWAPLLMICGNLEGSQAGEAEIRKLLGNIEGDRLVVKDTSRIDPSRLSALHGYGRIHIQATDPQSVAGGLPFRVFQTTACSRVLLTDRKPELLECYRDGKEILTYGSEADFSPALQRALALNESELSEIANRGHKRFLEQHTWAHRLNDVMNTVRRNAPPANTLPHG
jgi:hypothetical protein